MSSASVRLRTAALLIEMATRGRHSVGITSDGTDAEYRQKVAGHYKQSASARKTLRLLLPADVALGIALAALRARPGSKSTIPVASLCR